MALSTAKAPAARVATAPAPRPAAALPYQQAKAVSLETGKPVVVYVGCPAARRVPGTVTAATDSLGTYAAGTVLVCYPFNGSLWVDAAMRCDDPPADIERAARSAGRKAEAVPKKLLDWS